MVFMPENTPESKVMATREYGAEVRLVGKRFDQAYAAAKKEQLMTGAAEGIKVKEPGKLTTKIIQEYVDDMITVSEQEIASAILFMLEREKMLVEGAGAAAVAAVLHHHLPVESAHTDIIVSGGNFDIGKLEACRKIALV